MSFIRSLMWLVIYISAIVYGVNYWMQHKRYLIDENDIILLGGQYAGYDTQKSFSQIHKTLSKKYPGHILPQKDLQWIFVNAGGWMGSMCLVHASLTEYVLFFGTAVDTTGHSGRYWANITDTIIKGKFKQWKEGTIHATDYGQGDTIKHVWGEATAVQWSADTWMIEYGRGFIPSTLPFALSDTIFGTQDFITMYYTFRIYTKALIQEARFLVVDVQKFASNYIY